MEKNRTSLVRTIDFTTEEEQEKLRKQEEKREQARKLEREKTEREAEEERKRKELEAEEQRKIMREINRKKFQNNPPPYKPSRMLSVDSDLIIANLEQDMGVLKENVSHLETMLYEIQDYLYRDDNKKRENLKLKKLKRKAKKR
jgi:hypothetical protein